MRPLTVLFAVIGLALLAVNAADAHKITYKTTAKLTSGGPTGAKGRLGCTTRGCPKKCRAGRKVTLLRDDETGGPDQKFGTATTNAIGTFDVKAPLVAGDYYVRVAQLRLPASAAHHHFCSAAVSVRVNF